MYIIHFSDLSFYLDTELVQAFQRFGFIQEIKLQSDRGFAFVKWVTRYSFIDPFIILLMTCANRFDTHQNAANAIVHLQGMNVAGREAKVSIRDEKGKQV